MKQSARFFDAANFVTADPTKFLGGHILQRHRALQ